MKNPDNGIGTVGLSDKINSNKDRIAEVEKRLAEINYKAVTDEDKQLIAGKREDEINLAIKEIEEALGRSLSGESREKMMRNRFMSDESKLDRAYKENTEYDSLQYEKKKLLVQECAHDLIESLGEYGIFPPDNDELIDVITSNQIIDYDRGELAKLLGLHGADQERIAKASADKAMIARFHRLLSLQLTSSDYKELILAPDFEISLIIKGHDFEEEECEVNDRELSDLGIDKLKEIIREILNDENVELRQGMFWNVLVSGKADYVLKTERKHEGDKRNYQRSSLFNYGVIRDMLGKRFLPRQLIMESKALDRYYVLQEKVNLADMLPITTSTFDLMMDSGEGEKIKAALKKESNKKELKEFMQGVEGLMEERDLMPDFIGQNLFFSINDENELKICLVDYGAFGLKYKNENDEVSKDIDEMNGLIGKLKDLVS